MYYKIDENTVWEDINEIRVKNFPPSPSTFSYIVKVYREWTNKKLGYTEIEGDAIYLSDLKPEVAGYAAIIGMAQNILINNLPNKLGEPIDINGFFK